MNCTASGQRSATSRRIVAASGPSSPAIDQLDVDAAGAQVGDGLDQHVEALLRHERAPTPRDRAASPRRRPDGAAARRAAASSAAKSAFEAVVDEVHVGGRLDLAQVLRLAPVQVTTNEAARILRRSSPAGLSDSR